jgi:hypothetical protein
MNAFSAARVPKSHSSHIDFGIVGDQLIVDDLSRQLGIAPTSGWNPHEPYVGKIWFEGRMGETERIRPSFGVWHFSTEGRVASECLEDHAVYLLDQIESQSAQIKKFVASNEYTVVLSLWYEGPDFGFDLPSEIVARLAVLCQRFDLRCFSTPDVDNET